MRPLSAITPELIAAELALMQQGGYNVTHRARELGVKYGTLRHHLKRPAEGYKRVTRKKPVIGKRLAALLAAGDELEKQVGIDTHAKREARKLWHAAKREIAIQYDCA
jgi:hypothetical protein